MPLHDPELLALRLWVGLQTWAERDIKPRFVALVCEVLVLAPSEDEPDLNPKERARVVGWIERQRARARQSSPVHDKRRAAATRRRGAKP